MKNAASWIGVAGSALQLLGTVLTLWGLLSAPRTGSQRLRALIGALWRSRESELAATLSDLNEDDKSRVLQGLAFLAVGYIFALVSQIWSVVLAR